MRSLSTICCYLCGVLLFGLLMTSFISVAPEGESFFAGLMFLEALAAAVFAVLALVFRYRKTVAPPRVVVASQVFAVAVTVRVLLCSVG